MKSMVSGRSGCIKIATSSEVAILIIPESIQGDMTAGACSAAKALAGHLPRLCRKPTSETGGLILTAGIL